MEKKASASQHDQLRQSDVEDHDLLTLHQSRQQEDSDQQDTMSGQEGPADDLMTRRSGSTGVRRRMGGSREARRIMRPEEPFLLETLVESLKCEQT